MTFGDIIKKEYKMVLTAQRKYGQYFDNSYHFVSLMQEFITEVRPSGLFFALFLGYIRKHIVLSFFSALRRHHVQAMMNLRQVCEAVAKASYAIAFPQKNNFIRSDSRNVGFEPKNLQDRSYKWLRANYPAGSQKLRKVQESINETCAHANTIYAIQNFSVFDKGRKFRFNFFDKDDPDLVKVDLWFIGVTAMLLMDLFFGVNKGRALIIFSANFLSKLKGYEKESNELKIRLLKNKRFKRFIII